LNPVPVGVLALGTYLPAPRMTAAALSEASGIPERIITEKFGLIQKPMPGPEDHPCEMGARAARRALDAAGVDPAEIDCVLSISEEYKERPLMVSGIKIQQLIGAKNAWALDLAQRCCTTISALRVARGLMRDDPSPSRPCSWPGGTATATSSTTETPASRSCTPWRPAAAPCSCAGDYDKNLLLESEIITDGDFADDVNVRAGGTMAPVSEAPFAPGDTLLDVNDVEAMKARLAERSHPNFMRVIRRAAERSGYTPAQVSYLAILHMKRSAHAAVLNELGLSLDQSTYLEQVGHIGQFDPILSLELGVSSGRLRPGHLAVSGQRRGELRLGGAGDPLGLVGEGIPVVVHVGEWVEIVIHIGEWIPLIQDTVLPGARLAREGPASAKTATSPHTQPSASQRSTLSRRSPATSGVRVKVSPSCVGMSHSAEPSGASTTLQTSAPEVLRSRVSGAPTLAR
jgi:3-oxoacyl-[acyl-carrier-protein] synthase-3